MRVMRRHGNRPRNKLKCRREWRESWTIGWTKIYKETLFSTINRAKNNFGFTYQCRKDLTNWIQGVFQSEKKSKSLPTWNLLQNLWMFVRYDLNSKFITVHVHLIKNDFTKFSDWFYGEANCKIFYIHWWTKKKHETTSS